MRPSLGAIDTIVQMTKETSDPDLANSSDSNVLRQCEVVKGPRGVKSEGTRGEEDVRSLRPELFRHQTWAIWTRHWDMFDLQVVSHVNIDDYVAIQ